MLQGLLRAAPARARTPPALAHLRAGADRPQASASAAAQLAAGARATQGPEPARRVVGVPGAWLEATELTRAAVASCVEELLKLRAAAASSAERLKRRSSNCSRKRPSTRRLSRPCSAQPGVGEFTAIRLVLELGDVAGRIPQRAIRLSTTWGSPRQSTAAETSSTEVTSSKLESARGAARGCCNARG